MTEDTKMIINELKMICGNMEGLQTEMKEVRSDMEELRTDVRGLQTEMKEVKADVRGLRTEMKEGKGTVHGIELKLENDTDRSIALVAENHVELNRKLDKVLAMESEKELLSLRLIRVESDVEKIKAKLAETA